MHSRCQERFNPHGGLKPCLTHHTHTADFCYLIYIYFVSACNNWFPWKVDQLWSFAAPGRVQSFSKIKTDSDPGIDKGWVGWETLPKGFSYLVTQKNFKEIPMSHPIARQIMISLVWGETWMLVLKGSKEIIMGSHYRNHQNCLHEG